jgi:hypothetical protein
MTSDYEDPKHELCVNSSASAGLPMNPSVRE